MENAHLEVLVRGLALLLLLFRFVAVFLPSAIGNESFGGLLDDWGVGEIATRLVQAKAGTSFETVLSLMCLVIFFKNLEASLTAVEMRLMSSPLP